MCLITEPHPLWREAGATSLSGETGQISRTGEQGDTGGENDGLFRCQKRLVKSISKDHDEQINVNFQKKIGLAPVE